MKTQRAVVSSVRAPEFRAFENARDASFASVTSGVDCPFSLVVDEAQLIFKLLESPSPGVRVAFRDLGLPIAGALAHRVVTRFHRELDPTDVGRVHDQIVFDWTAGSVLLPAFDGVLRFRADTIARTQIVLSGSYVPPLGAAGAVLDRFLGRKLAYATLTRVMARLVTELESLWAREKAGSVALFAGLGLDGGAIASRGRA